MNPPATRKGFACKAAKYYDTRQARTPLGCELTVDEDDQTLTVTRGRETLQKANIADVLYVATGSKSGFLWMLLKAGALNSNSPEPHQMLLDICPDKDAIFIAKVLRAMRGWG